LPTECLSCHLRSDNYFCALSQESLKAFNQIKHSAIFPADGEVENGWILRYTYDTTNGFILANTFNTTRNGSGGGVWESAAGLAAGTAKVNDVYGTYLFVPVGNGTFDVNNGGQDYGDGLLRLGTDLTVSDYFTPADVFTYQPPGSTTAGRCQNDTDLGSGGVMLLPDAFFPQHDRLLVQADKESKIFVVDRDHLGEYNGPTNNSPGGLDLIVDEVQTPVKLGGGIETGQGYWGSPAYWEWVDGSTQRAIYYSVDATSEDDTKTNTPLPINMYILQTSGSYAPVVQTPDHSTGTVFCGHGGAPAISSNGTDKTSGIVWAVELSNSSNPTSCPNHGWGPAVLHAYDARTLGGANGATELYNSSQASGIGYPAIFTTPTIFKGRVYVGTRTEVDVFGTCSQCH
ncbi:MAG: hypothetical protein LAO09_06600, partial [Acidobacteriia bacterium]|nr:hypothetical protein [Terriglobia bacterium]